MKKLSICLAACFFILAGVVHVSAADYGFVKIDHPKDWVVLTQRPKAVAVADAAMKTQFIVMKADLKDGKYVKEIAYDLLKENKGTDFLKIDADYESYEFYYEEKGQKGHCSVWDLNGKEIAIIYSIGDFENAANAKIADSIEYK